MYPNLRMHDRNYPTPDVVRSKIRDGRLGGQREFRQMSTATWGYGARGVVRPEFAHYLSGDPPTRMSSGPAIIRPHV